MKIDSLGDVIAERLLRCGKAEGRVQRVVISLGRPLQFPDSQDFFCPYQIVGIGDEKVRYAGGVDSLQAIQLAIDLIAAELSSAEEDLSWEAGEVVGDLGFSKL
ncbi:MAG TPA: hypothetical protein VG675_02560 [Bryobacteraceae bacterium]|nr:hypothetical protein [Bryobacteraceae bacterium]